MTAETAAAAALTLYLAGLVAAFGARSWIHRRRTGSTGFRGLSGAPRIGRVVGREPLRGCPRARRRGPRPGPHRHHCPHRPARRRSVGGPGDRRLRRRAGRPGGHGRLLAHRCGHHRAHRPGDLRHVRRGAQPHLHRDAHRHAGTFPSWSPRPSPQRRSSACSSPWRSRSASSKSPTSCAPTAPPTPATPRGSADSSPASAARMNPGRHGDRAAAAPWRSSPHR